MVMPWLLFNILMAMLLVMQPALLDMIVYAGLTEGRMLPSMLFSSVWVLTVYGSGVVRCERRRNRCRRQ